MRSKLEINESVKIKNTSFKVIGIDTYLLTNVFGNPKKWISYTLIDNKNNKTWISYGAIPDYFIQWTLIPEKEFKKESETPLNMELTGVANVTFIGNPGFSTPVAELIWFNLKGNKYDFYVVEKFIKNVGKKADVQESYYDAGKILKDFKP